MSDDIVVGRNAVIEVLRSDISVNRVVIRQNARPEAVEEIIELCKQRHIRFETISSQKLESLPGNPRDVAAFVSPIDYAELEDIIDEAGETSIILILDGIEDPHNLGAIIRSAECFGVDGIVIPKNNACPLNVTVMKTSSGAATYVPVARVTNIAESLEKLKNAGYWVYGTDAKAKQSLAKTNFDKKTAIVIGSEGKGMRQLVTKRCDVLISIPMFGRINSLNASVSTGIVLYEIVRNIR
jgi:23S rRNA (guanosine2251-2'-O)-methyltransferase